MKTEKPKVSFDYDGTLSTKVVQEYARSLIEKGVEVHVVTTRYDENHRHEYFKDYPDWIANSVAEEELEERAAELWKTIDDLGIPRERVRFTNMQWKSTYLVGTKFKWHLDDNSEESSRARSARCEVPIILVDGREWLQKCERLLNKTEDNDIGL